MVLNPNADCDVPFSMKLPTFNTSEEAHILTETPLTQLSSETCIKLSEMLNGRKILRYNGHDRDWRGIAELAKVRNFCNNNSDDPMQTVLSQWIQRNSEEATCFNLLLCLSKIDRWDVSDDIYTFLVKDAHLFQSRRSYANATGMTYSENTNLSESEEVAENSDTNNENYVPESVENDEETDNELDADGGSSSSHSPPPSPPPGPTPSPPPNIESLIERVEELTNSQNNSVSQSSTAVPATSEPTPIALLPKTVDTEKHTEESNPLTRQDAARLRRGLPLTKYDAFVLYAELDQNYANEMQQKLETFREFNFQLVFKNRDMLGGTFFHDAVTELMEDRCNYVLLIVTTNFSRDYESCFFFHNAQTLQLQENRRKIIPLLYCAELPRRLRGLHTLKYHSEHFWDLLVDSLSVKELPPLTKEIEYKDDIPALPSLPKPPDSTVGDDEEISKPKPQTTKSTPLDKRGKKTKFLKKPIWSKKNKIKQ